MRAACCEARQLCHVARKPKWAETGAIMSGHYKQMRHGNGEAARRLRERLARKEVGDAAYDKSVSYADDRAFKIFGAVLIVFLAAVVLGVVLMGC
jgi:hypothetical protein